MKRLVFFIFIIVTMMATGCREQIKLPKTDSDFLIISHVKEPALTFLDPEQNDVLFSENSRFPLTEMSHIGEGNIIATSKNSSSLIGIDVKKGTSQPFLELNEGLTALAYDSERDWLFVADVSMNCVHLIEVGKKKVVNRFAVGSYPTDLLLVGDMLYVLNGNSSDVTVIELNEQKVLDTFSVIERPSGIYFDGHMIWVGGHGAYGELNKHIFAYDPVTLEQKKELNVGLMPIAFYGDDTSPFMYVLCHGDHALYRVQKETYEVIDSIEVGQNPNYVLGNVKHLYVTNFDGDSVSVIDRDTFNVVDELSVPAGPYAMIFGGMNDGE